MTSARIRSRKPRSKRCGDGFTLIELLVVIAIMGVMMTVGVVSFSAGRASMGTFAAARDVMSMIRRARSTALVTQKPVVLIYSNGKTGDGESCAKVEIQAVKLFSGNKTTELVYDLNGEPVNGEEFELVHIEGKDSDGKVATDDGKGGETIEDVLAPEALPEGVTKGLKLRVLREDEELEVMDTKQHSKISIFSTADNISRTYQAGKEEPAKDTAAEAEAATETEVKVVFAANGTVEPAHKIWIYPEEKTPEKGLCVEVDRFGAITCADLEGK